MWPKLCFYHFANEFPDTKGLGPLPNLDADRFLALDRHPQRNGEREDRLADAHAAVLPGVAPSGDDVLLVHFRAVLDTLRNILQDCDH